MVSFPKISPNLLLGVGAIVAAVFLVSQIRKAGADVVGALPTIDEGLRQSLTDIAGSLATTTKQVADISGGISQFQQDVGTQLTQFQQDASTNLKSITDFFGNLFKAQAEEPIFDPTKEPSEGLLTQEEILACPCGSSIVQDSTGKVIQKCLTCPTDEPIIKIDEPFVKTAAELAEEESFRRSLIQPTPEPIIEPVPISKEIISELPTEQEFVGGGISFIGGTIRENPIDTLSEAIALGLTASQAADFLAATGGVVTPSQIELGLVDPDIQNIVAGFFGGGLGQAFPVSSTPLETLSIKESEELKAAEFTCKEFGLNCELVDGMMA